MAILDLSVLLVFLTIVSLVVGTPCTKPSIRKEWRAFSTQEKTAWIRALNVRMKLTALFSVVD